MSNVDRIMLRYLRIAPKPETGGGSVSATERGGPDVCSTSGRGKRKYSKEKIVMGSGNCKRCRKRRSERRDGFGGEEVDSEVVTLPLLPETPDRGEFPFQKGYSVEQMPQGPFWLSFSGSGGACLAERQSHRPVPPHRTAVWSYITVERVTDTWVDGYGLGRTDNERKMYLERDTCPGFISDGQERVTWTNGAYRKMVSRDTVREGVPENGNMIVWLVMRERPMLTYASFTCTVRLQYTCRNREGSSITLPCDVWRMDGGGFAWRLDVKAALCL